MLSKECIALQGKNSAMEGDAWVLSFSEAENRLLHGLFAFYFHWLRKPNELTKNQKKFFLQKNKSLFRKIKENQKSFSVPTSILFLRKGKKMRASKDFCFIWIYLCNEWMFNVEPNKNLYATINGIKKNGVQFCWIQFK